MAWHFDACATAITFLSVGATPDDPVRISPIAADLPVSLQIIESAMPPIISVSHLSKTYGSGFKALNDINLEINRGEIFALLVPNGATKTTLTSMSCGIANLSEGRVSIDGHDIQNEYRAARALIGLVPQELHTDAFESVWATVSFSRGLW